ADAGLTADRPLRPGPAGRLIWRTSCNERGSHWPRASFSQGARLTEVARWAFQLGPPAALAWTAAEAAAAAVRAAAAVVAAAAWAPMGARWMDRRGPAGPAAAAGRGGPAGRRAGRSRRRAGSAAAQTAPVRSAPTP